MPCENTSEKRNTSVSSWIFACENETTDFAPRISCHLKLKWRWNILGACVYAFVIQISINIIFCQLCFVFAWMAIGGICWGTNENRDLVSQGFDFCCSESVCLWSVIPQKKFLLNRTDPTALGVLLS